MFQDVCTNLIIVLFISTFMFAIADISTRLFKDICSRCTNKSSIIPPTPADYRYAFNVEPDSTSSEIASPASNIKHQAERTNNNGTSVAVYSPKPTLKSVGVAALALDAMTVRQLRDLCSSDKKRFSGYSKFVSQETQLRSFIRSRML